MILSHNRIDNASINYASMSQAIPVTPVSVQYGLNGANPARMSHAVQVVNPCAIYTEDAAMFADGLDSEVLAGLPVIAVANPRVGDISLERLLRAAPVEASARPEDHAKYMLTSGSTGLPEAVIATHRSTALNSAQLAAQFDDGEPPVWVINAPWSHTMGTQSQLHYALHQGGALYIDEGQPVPGRFAETVRNLKGIVPTHHHTVPAAWLLLVEALETDQAQARNFFSRIQVLQYCGSTMGQSIADRIEAIAVCALGEKITFATAYGTTETRPTACSVYWLNDRMGPSGPPLPGTFFGWSVISAARPSVQ